jgi:hypothetical protein
MSVGLAREAAVDWVDRDGSRQAGFRGAYFSGSTVGLAAEAELPTGSDVDVVVVTEGAEQRPKLGKFGTGGTTHVLLVAALRTPPCGCDTWRPARSSSSTATAACIRTCCDCSAARSWRRVRDCAPHEPVFEPTARPLETHLVEPPIRMDPG